jgi:hypothetical protein
MTSYDNHDVYSAEIWAEIGSLLDNHRTDRQEICQEPVEAAGYLRSQRPDQQEQEQFKKSEIIQPTKNVQ